MVIREKLYTVDEFWELSQQPEYEDQRLELIEGVMYEMPPSRPINTVIAGRIVHFFNAFVIERDLGHVTAADGGFVLEPGTVRLPDAAYISKARVPELTGNVFPVAPDLAVEVISPNETPRTIVDKVRLYLHAGTQLVWVIYPDDKIVDVYRLHEDDSLNLRIFDIDDTLNGENVLPGFALPVQKIFP